MIQRFRYRWYHRPTGNTGEDTTLRDMTLVEFLSALAWWNSSDDWFYAPLPGFDGQLAQHECRNVPDWLESLELLERKLK